MIKNSFGKFNSFTGAAICGGAVVLFGVLSLLGRALDIDWLKSPSASHASVHPLAAIGLTLTGFGVILFVFFPSNFSAEIVRRLIGSLLAAFGLLVLASYIFGFSTFMDGWFVRPENVVVRAGGKMMPPQTAFNFLLVGISLAFLGAKKIFGKISALAGAGALVATFAAGLGLLYNTIEFFGISHGNQMAIYVDLFLDRFDRPDPR